MTRPPAPDEVLRGAYGPYRANNDLLSYHLDVRVDPEKKTIAGKNTIRFKMLQDGTRIQLDLCANLHIDKIVLAARAAEIRARIQRGVRRLPDHAEGRPRLRDRLLLLRQSARGRAVRRHGVPQGSVRPAPWINTACEGEGAAIWWPNKDQWRDEVETDGDQRRRPERSRRRLERQVRRQDRSRRRLHALGLARAVSDQLLQRLAEHRQLHAFLRSAGRPAASTSTSCPAASISAAAQFAQAKPMLEAYQKYFGEYPFKKDGYKLIEAPYSGMEHQSAVTYGNRFANGYLERDWTGVGISTKFDFIIIHESGHEWFGNAISAADVSDMWIHEGWTTYLEGLYVEHVFGHDDAIKYVNGYKSKVRNREPIITTRGIHRSPPQDMYVQRRALPQHASQRRQRRRAMVEAAARPVPALQAIRTS